MMHVLAQETKVGSNIKRLSQEISNFAQKQWVICFIRNYRISNTNHLNWFKKNSGHDATPILIALNGASAYPRVSQALSAMLAKNALNPADITVVSIQ
jgi:negative elongation factor C/D